METTIHIRKTCQGFKRVVLYNGALLSPDLPEWCALAAGTFATTTGKLTADAHSKTAIVKG